MIIEYEVECFDRCLVIKCDNSYAKHERKIKHILDKAYYEWHSPEDIEDPVEQKIVNDSCCEEHMMYRLQEVYPSIDKGSWDTFYYGNDDDEIAEDRENHQHDHNYNIYWLNRLLDTLEDRNYEFEPFEKLGNEAYHIVEDCIEKLKELREQYAEEEM
jgi:hypothetical protein